MSRRWPATRWRPGSAVYAGNQDRGAGHLRGAAAGGQALQHPHHHHLAGRGRHANWLDSITEPDIAQAVRKGYEIALPAESFASMSGLLAMSQPDDVDINEILFRPTRQEL